MNHQEQLERFAQWLAESRQAVFFGGAGVSTESGIPDFRSTDGLYNQTYDEPPEEILSGDYFYRYPEKFYRFYWDKMIYPDAEPGPAHRALALLEKTGHLAAVVTQNIDGLHQAAGSRRVYELHGSVHHSRCTRCGKVIPSPSCWKSGRTGKSPIAAAAGSSSRRSSSTAKA